MDCCFILLCIDTRPKGSWIEVFRIFGYLFSQHSDIKMKTVRLLFLMSVYIYIRSMFLERNLFQAVNLSRLLGLV